MSCVIGDTIEFLKHNKYWLYDQRRIMQKTAERVHIVENHCLSMEKTHLSYSDTQLLPLKFLFPNCNNSGTAPQLVLWHSLTCQDTIKMLKHVWRHQQFLSLHLRLNTVKQQLNISQEAFSAPRLGLLSFWMWHYRVLQRQSMPSVKQSYWIKSNTNPLFEICQLQGSNEYINWFWTRLISFISCLILKFFSVLKKILQNTERLTSMLAE